MKNKLLRLTLLLLIAVCSVTNVWAGVSGGYIYFDPAQSGWGSPTTVEYIISHDSYSCWYKMASVTNTKLYYKSSGSWSDAKYIAFTANYGWADSGDNCEGNPYDSRKGYGPDGKKYTAKSTYGVNSGSVYLFYASSSSNDASITTSSPAGYKSGGVTDLNSTQTVKFSVSNNGATPAELSSGTTPAQIRMRSYKFTSGTNGSVSAESPSDWSAGSSTYNKTFTAARTATTTLTVSNVVDGYTFLGWYSAANGGTELSTNLAYTYYPTAATTVYARFSHETTHSVDITYVCASPSATVSTATSQAIGQVTASSITAPTVTGYTFSNWTLGTGISNQSANTSANPISVKTLSSGTYTMQANYTEDLSSPYIVMGGNKIVTTGTAWRTTADANNKMNKKTGHSTESNAYFTVNVTAVNQGDANTNYQFKLYNTSTSTYYGLSGSGQYYLNRAESGTAKTTSSPGINVELRADALGEYELKVNYSSTPTLTVTYPTAYAVTFGKGTGGGTVTAKYSNTSFTSGTKVQSGKTVTFTQTAATGYTFSKWYTTSTGSGGTQLSTSDTYDHTVSSTNNVYAIYTENKSDITIEAGDNGSITTPSPNASPYSLGVATKQAITATPDEGYYFAGWEVTGNAAVDNVSTASTYAKTDGTDGGSGTVTATFLPLEKIYFRNIFDDGAGNVSRWSNVYVYFGITWEGGRAVSNSNASYKVAMTKIAETDVYWAYVPRSFTTLADADLKKQVAFSNASYTTSYKFYHATASHDKAATRGDYNKALNMFVPYHTAKSINTGSGGVDYFDNGYWMKYDTRANQGAGYYLKKYNSLNNYTQEGEFIATNDDATFIQFQERIDAGNSTLSYMITSAAGLNYVADASITSAKNTNVGVSEDTRALASYDVKFSITTTSEGYYTFILDQSGDKMKLSVIYPVEIGDYVLIHEYNDGSAKKNYSDFIKKSEASAKTVSMYLNMGAGTKSLKLYKCTAISAGHPVWGSYTTVGTGSGLFNTTTFSEGNGVYKFDVAISTDAVTGITNAGLYNGPYYIKTNSAPGGWADYKKNVLHQNTINFSTEDAKTFDYYMCAWIGDAGTNVKCVIANDYNNQLSDTLQGDAVIGALAQTMPAAGNVRFSYNSYTNEIKRAYISGSAYAVDRFLVLEGDAKMFNGSGTPLTTGNGRVSGLNEYEMNFTDDHNWIYEATVMAQPNARFKLTAKFNNQIQYFYGAAGARTDETTALLLGGSDENKYKMRIVYDFKTNRMIKAFIPSGTITTDLGIEADLMIVREHQEDAQQVSFSGSGKLSDVKTVFGAMKFNKWTINNKSKAAGHAALTPSLSRYARDLFYISFPFDVNLSDAFGFGTYGTHWIIEYYDGKGRAKNGFWADSESNWKFVTPAERKNFTMNAFEGYILALDLDELGESSSVWDNDVEDVYVYFPSAAEVEDIEGTNRLIPIDQDGYECTIGPRPGMSDDRRNKDGYWHCIGVPSFANYNKDLYDTNGGTKIDWTSSSMPYLYEWNSASNTLSVTSSATFSFRATFSYLVQYAGASIYWSAVNATPASVVARQKDEPTNVEFRMELQQGEEKADQAFVRMTTDENVTTGFDFNYDLSKEFNKNKANIYTMVTTTMEDGPSVTEVAGNVLPMSEQMTIVPVGVKIATNDDYTFSIPDGTSGVGVTLIDKLTGTRTNISAVDYTVSLEAGTYNERFVLEISPIEQVITNLEPSAMEQQSDVRKVLIDGLLYIVRDGKVYDARGAKVE